MLVRERIVHQAAHRESINWSTLSDVVINFQSVRVGVAHKEQCLGDVFRAICRQLEHYFHCELIELSRAELILT